jgi:surface antigen
MALPPSSFLLALLIMSGALTGCASVGGPTFGSARSKAAIAANASIKALEGGMISRINGLKISDQDRFTALKTEYKALEAAPGGQELVWQGDGMTGSVVAAAPFQVGNQNCRQYRQTVIVKGETLSANGTACRNDTGAWTPL